MTYSRFINTLKVVLSLLALALLSTLFLVQRNVGNNGDEIPFADVELEKRLQSQQVTAPFFSGKTSDGHLVTFTAETARPSDQGTNRSEANAMSAQVDLQDGTRLNMTAQTALIDNQSHDATLVGDVTLTSTNGYTITSESLTANMRELQLESPGPVSGTGPAGDFTANQMRITQNKETNDTYLFFTNGVKLVYTPKK